MDTTQLDSPAIKSVAELAKQAADPFIKQVGPAELGKWMIFDRTKGHEILELLPELPPRVAAFHSLDALVAAAKHYGDESTAIYFNAGGVTIVLDDQQRRRSTLTMAFTKTPEWLLLEGFASGTAYDQASLIRLFRLRLAHACPAAPTVVAKIRKVRFQASQAVDSDLQRGRESLGKEITAELLQAEEVPEQVTLQVRPFLEVGRGGLADIDCLLDINPHAQKFSLLPTPGAMQEMIDDELELLGKDLAEQLAADPAKTFPIFYGTP